MHLVFTFAFRVVGVVSVAPPWTAEVMVRKSSTISCAFNAMDPDLRERTLDVDIALYL